MQRCNPEGMQISSLVNNQQQCFIKPDRLSHLLLFEHLRGLIFSVSNQKIEVWWFAEWPWDDLERK